MAPPECRDAIRIGQQYPFYSTSVANPEVTPWSGQTVTVLSAEPVVADSEPLFRVRAGDGHEFQAFEGELNGYYFDTHQYVGHPDFTPPQV